MRVPAARRFGNRPSSLARCKRIRMRSLSAASLLFAFAAPAAAAEPPKPFTPEALAFYEKDVLPVLKANCYKCHAAAKLKANFSLKTRTAILKGGDLGPAVSLDKPDESHLLRAINYKD